MISSVNWQFSADLVTFTEEIIYMENFVLCAVYFKVGFLVKIQTSRLKFFPTPHHNINEI